MYENRHVDRKTGVKTARNAAEKILTHVKMRETGGRYKKVDSNKNPAWSEIVDKRRFVMATATESARKKLVEDFRALTADTEELLRATASITGERASAARTKVEERLRAAKEAVGEFRDDLAERGRVAAEAADRAVRDHPWESVAVAAGIGFLLGMLTARR